ncbi:MAG: VCBS repeat-containing protein [Pseudomonadota bacterium]
MHDDTVSFLHRFATLLLLLLTLPRAYADYEVDPDYVGPSFRVQTSVLPVNFPNQPAAALAFAGRNRDGEPVLGLVRFEQGDIRYREIGLPASAVAIDVGPVNDDSDALFVLAGGVVYAVRAFADDLAEVANGSSMYRGRSLAELSSELDFARDVDGDNGADLLIPDFDVLHVIRAGESRSIELPSYRRGWDQTVAYIAPSVVAAPSLAGGTLYNVRGNELLTFAASATTARSSELGLGLSNELERETFYNGFEDIDQNDLVLREVDSMSDINGDDLPDIVTLETVSEGVFDKTTTYRVHHGRLEYDALTFDSEADTVLSSRGFQVGARIAPLDDDEQRKIMVTASVQVGVRTIIGALFSRAVTMRIEIYPPGDDGTIAPEPSTTVKARVKFDFGTGQVEFPTIAFGDIDGDGVNDLIVKERRRALNWRRGMGDGSFDTDSIDLDVTGPANGTNVVLADLTGDDRDEVVVLYGRADGDSLSGQIGVFGNFPGER